MNYTVNAVAPEVRDYQSKYGDMSEYTVRFNESGDTIVHVNQKSSTPPPKAGDTLTGTVDMSADYGPKFKKEFTPTAGAPGTYTGKPKQPADNYSMYMSYAKDIAIAIIENVGIKEFDEKEYNKVIETVVSGANTLFEHKDAGKDEAEAFTEEVEKINSIFGA